jgi:hypothetical protein
MLDRDGMSLMRDLPAFSDARLHGAAFIPGHSGALRMSPVLGVHILEATDIPLLKDPAMWVDMQREHAPAVIPTLPLFAYEPSL